MSQILAECIEDTTISGIVIGKTYKVEHDLDWKIIYNETKTTFESVVGNKNWFYEHFKPISCNNYSDMKNCNTYKDGREHACYGFKGK